MEAEAATAPAPKVLVEAAGWAQGLAVASLEEVATASGSATKAMG